MKTRLLAFLLPLFACAQETPQTVVPRQNTNFYLRDVWFNTGSGCDILNYYLFHYIDEHPDRVKFPGKDEVAIIDGFVDYAASRSPIIVSDHDGKKSCLIFFKNQILTPWGQEIVFLVDRDHDGYLTAFGEKASVNDFEDPWKKEGFKYSKAVGITLKSRPAFIEEGARLLVPLNDNEYNRIGKGFFRDK